MINTHDTGKAAYRAMFGFCGGDNKRMAKLLGVTVQTICAWKRGDKMPSIDNLVLIADLTGKKVDDLVVRSKL